MADRDRIDDILSAVGYGRWQIPILMATIVGPFWRLLDLPFGSQVTLMLTVVT